MVVTAAGAPRIVLPPALDYLPWLFLACPARTALEASLAAFGAGADLGRSGRLAAETAASLRKDGASAVVVRGGPADAVAAEILCVALAEAGIAVEGPMLEPPAAGLLDAAPDGLITLPFDALHEDPDRILRRLGDVDPECLRLHRPLRPTTGAAPRDGAAWAALLGLEGRDAAARLRRFVHRLRPRWTDALDVVLGWAAMAVDPLEEMYAGNHLADRNRELLSVILP